MSQSVFNVVSPIDGSVYLTRAYAGQEIARTIGASREMVSRVMRDLHVQGLIEESDGCIWLRDNIGDGARE